MPEVAGQAPVGELADLARQLHAGRPGPDDRKGHEEALLGRVDPRLGDLEGAEHPASQLHGVVDRLHPRGDQRELVVAEVRLAGPGRHDQAVVGVGVVLAREGLRLHRPSVQVEPRHLAQDDVHVLATAQHVPQHVRDLTRRHDAGRHLVQERLEQVVVPLVDEGHLDVARAGEEPGGRQSAEAATDDDDVVAWSCAHNGSFPRGGGVVVVARPGYAVGISRPRAGSRPSAAGGGASPGGGVGPGGTTGRPWRGRAPLSRRRSPRG